MSIKLLMPTILATGVATALLVSGAHYVYSTQSELASLRSQAAKPQIIETDPEELAVLASTLHSVLEAPSQAAGEPGQSELSPADKWIYGNPTARFSLFEFTDTECPYCKEHFPVIRTLVDTSGGNINAGLIHVPVQGEASRVQAAAVECAGDQGGSQAAWKMMDMILHSARIAGQGINTPTPVLARNLGLDQQRFIACTESVEVMDRLAEDLGAAIELGIAQTPTTAVIDNETGKSHVLQGANASSEGIINAIEQLAMLPRGQ